jgi:hypothetical protein
MGSTHGRSTSDCRHSARAAVSPQFGGYERTDAGTAAAERLDYEARASELVASGAAIRIIVGADDEQAIVSSALTAACHVLGGQQDDRPRVR